MILKYNNTQKHNFFPGQRWVIFSEGPVKCQAYRAYLTPKLAITRHSFWKMAKSVTGISVIGLAKPSLVSPHMLLVTLNSLVGA